jgi:hypothetical protein
VRRLQHPPSWRPAGASHRDTPGGRQSRLRATPKPSRVRSGGGAPLARARLWWAGCSSALGDWRRCKATQPAWGGGLPGPGCKLRVGAKGAWRQAACACDGRGRLPPAAPPPDHRAPHRPPCSGGSSRSGAHLDAVGAGGHGGLEARSAAGAHQLHGACPAG